MDSWSKRRQLAYAAALTGLLLAAGILIWLLFVRKTPTCSDGVQNGGEQGIDCGGGCPNLCQNSFSSPTVAWTRFEEVAPGLYNVGAYIINPNTVGQADKTPYHIALYDGKGMLINETDGTVTLPPHRNTLAFQGAVPVGQSLPERALFEFTAEPVWQTRSDPLSALSIGAKAYSENGSGSSLSVEVKNSGLSAIDNIGLSAVLYDGQGQVVGFSRTVLDEIPPRGSVSAPFTWPVSRQGSVVSIEVLPVAE